MKWYEVIDVVTLATVFAILLVVGLSLWAFGAEAKEIALSAGSVLGGFLAKSGLDKVRGG